jgi:hypothetical protein
VRGLGCCWTCSTVDVWLSIHQGVLMLHPLKAQEIAVWLVACGCPFSTVVVLQASRGGCLDGGQYIDVVETLNTVVTCGVQLVVCKWGLH